MRRRILRACAYLGASALLYLGILCYPEPLFPYRIRQENVFLYSDSPLPSVAAPMLREAIRRMARSPWYGPDRSHRIFICQTGWRWRLFSLHLAGVGGINTVFLARTIFLRKVDWGTGRLIGPGGGVVEPPRDLPYYLAHEMAHGLTAARIGRWRYFRSETWKKEGYADFLGLERFDWEDYLRKYREGDRRMDPASGYYWLYLLAVGRLIQVEGRTPDAVFGETRSLDSVLAGLKP